MKTKIIIINYTVDTNEVSNDINKINCMIIAVMIIRTFIDCNVSVKYIIKGSIINISKALSFFITKNWLICSSLLKNGILSKSILINGFYCSLYLLF